MRNELQRHKRSDKVKWVLTSIAFVLAFVMIAGLCLQLFGTGKVKPSEWFKKSDGNQTEEPAGSEEQTTGGLVMPEETKGNGIALMSAAIAEEDYEENGISAQAESAYTVTATIENEEWTDGKVNWSLAWGNTSSWASSNSVTTYISITPSADTKSCTVTCLRGEFNVYAVVTAALHSDPSKKATVRIDYLCRPTSLTCYTQGTGSGELYKNGFNVGSETMYVFTLNKGNGTVDGVLKITSATITLSEQYIWAAVRNNRYFKAGLSTYGMSASAFVPKSSATLVCSQSGSAVQLNTLMDLYSINGNGAFSPYVQNALKEVLDGFASGNQNFGRITLTGTYSKGDISIPVTGSMEINHFVWGSYSIPSVTIPQTAVSTDNSSLLF